MGLFYLVLGVGLLLAGLVALRWLSRVPPRHVAAGLRWLAIGAGGLVAAWLLLTGRAAQVVFVLLPFLPAIRQWWNRRMVAAPPDPAARSDVETAWLRMTLEHATGAMDGLVLQGAFRGRRLAELSQAELLDLLATLRVADADSAALLESYLDALGLDWRSARPDGGTGGAPGGAPPAGGTMSRAEAAMILGVPEDADREAVSRAWREAMKRNHPDQGGSAYLAARINEARDVLLG